MTTTRHALRLIVVFVVSFCCVQAYAQSPKLIRLGFSSGWDALPAIVAIERGFLAEQGLVASSLSVSSAPVLINSLAAGSTDFAILPQRVLLVMAAANVPVRIVAMGGWGTEMELVVPKASKARTIADIKGKRIGLLSGSEAFPILIRLLNRQKLRPSDVTIVNMQAEQISQAFSKNLVDAVFETRHFTVAYLQNNEGRVLVPAQEVTKATGSIGAVPVVTTAAEIDSSPEVVQSFVTAWAKAMKYIQQDPDDAAHLLQIYLHRQGARVTPEIAGAWVRLTKYNQYGWSKAAVTDAEYNGWALNVGNILKVQPKLAEYIDNSYMDKAVKQIGLQ